MYRKKKAEPCRRFSIKCGTQTIDSAQIKQDKVSIQNVSIKKMHTRIPPTWV